MERSGTTGISLKTTGAGIDRQLSVAPMMDWTDDH